MQIDPKLRKALTGISGILVTPFDNSDQVAPKRLKPKHDKPRKRSRSLKRPFASACFAQIRMPIAG